MADDLSEDKDFQLEVDGDISLRTLTNNDATELFNLTDNNRTYLKEWLPWLDGTRAVKDTEIFIQDTREQLEKGNGFQLGIWYQGKLAGVVGLHKIDKRNRATSIGYWLGESSSGKGVMTSAVKRLLKYIFEELNLHRVVIAGALGNKKSRVIPERLGFASEGIERESEWLYDHFIDHQVYSMLEEEYKEKDLK